MAHQPRLSDTGANAGVNAIVALLNTGYFRIYDGVQATNANTALGTQVLLAELRFGATAFGGGAAGVATANAITAGVAVVTSTATWFRLLKSDGTTVIADGSVGATGSGSDLELNTTSIVTGGSVSVSSFTFTQSES